MHIERLGTAEVEGIEMGDCYIFPKIDGSNGQLWWTIDDGVGRLHAASRNRELSLDNDNQGFFNWCVTEYGPTLARFFRANPSIRLYGEWLCPHALKTYRDEAWRKFYVFDVMLDDRFMHYDEYKMLLDQYEIEYIPPICMIRNPSYEKIMAQLDKNGYLIKDGQGTGEGVVIKNYNFVNKYGRVTWAKVVTNEFKAKHARESTTVIKDYYSVEQRIVDKYVTSSLVDKELHKIEEWTSKDIPRLLSTVYYCFITEEAWHFVKEFKSPKIDFALLNRLTVQKIKELKPELF